MKYYLDKCYMQDGACISYESGPFDKMYFDTLEDAQNYAFDNDYRLEENELFCIEEVDA